jgi:peroxiredoxin 6
VLFSHPGDYTPVCTTELGVVAKLAHAGEFAKRNVKVAALSCNDNASHHGWIRDIEASQAVPPGTWPYPIIADPERTLAVKLGMLDPAEADAQGLPVAARAVFVVGPDKKLKLSLLYPATTGRNFVELLRVLDALQLNAAHGVATPANWGPGDDVMIPPSVSAADADARFPKGYRVVEVPSGKPYLRITQQPTTQE